MRMYHSLGMGGWKLSTNYRNTLRDLPGLHCSTVSSRQLRLMVGNPMIKNSLLEWCRLYSSRQFLTCHLCEDFSVQRQNAVKLVVATCLAYVSVGGIAACAQGPP